MVGASTAVGTAKVMTGCLLAGMVAAGPVPRIGDGLGGGQPTGARGLTTGDQGYVAPVTGAMRVVRGFEPPPSPYSAGHRGVDLATSTGEPIRAAGPGTVSFAGQVAGRGVLVIAHPDGVRTEYEPVAPTVRPGDQVRSGQPVAIVTGAHPNCSPDGCLHWAARRDGRYLDPLTLLGRLGQVRLLPWS